MGWFRRESPEKVVATIVELGDTAATAQGKADVVLEAAQDFAAASEDERTISRLVWSSLDDTRRLTGCSPERAAVIAGIARTLRERVGKDELVCGVAQTVLPGTEDRRIVDRLLDGEEQAVRD